MNYPLLSEYVESIKYAEDNLCELDGLRPVMDANGNPCMSSGNFAVVFKMREEGSGKLYALKCFLREQEGRAESYRQIAKELEGHASDYLISIQYFEGELFVDTRQTDEREFPVLLMDWVEGVPLDRYLRSCLGNRSRLADLAYRFGRLALWLGAQEFAHGDLKPDNILVREDGQLVLVDYDGMFVPAMRGQRARELGSVDFRHPSRTVEMFDGSIDDFSLISILLSLKAIAIEPELLDRYGAVDRLLLSAVDYREPGKSEVLREIQALSEDLELSDLLEMFYIACVEEGGARAFFQLFSLTKPYVQVEGIPLFTKVTREDLEEAWADEYGVKYSRDGVRLLKAPRQIKKYRVKESVKVICDRAFFYCVFLNEIVFPSSLTAIGDSAFSHCTCLNKVMLPSSLIHIGVNPFASSGVREIYSDSSRFSVEDGILVDRCKHKIISCFHEKEKYVIPEGISSIGSWAFSGCWSLNNITLPSSLMSIGSNPFVNSSVREVCSDTSRFLVEDGILIEKSKHKIISCFHEREVCELPEGISCIGVSAFGGCNLLAMVMFPSSLISIGSYAFWGCSSLTRVVFSSSLMAIGASAFSGCSSLRSLELPSSLTTIESNAFLECSSLTRVVFPSSLMAIGASAFSGCSSLRSLELPSSLTSIGSNAFLECSSLTRVVFPSSLTTIGSCAFDGCSSLISVDFPSSLTSIGGCAFWNCSSLSCITFPVSLANIGYGAFSGCRSLNNIIFFSSLTTIGSNVFKYCDSLKLIKVPYGTMEKFKDLLKESGFDGEIQEL